MESFLMRELYARTTENQIAAIKDSGENASNVAVKQLELLLERTSEPDKEAVFNWILSCFQGDTEQTEAGELSETQLMMASIVVSAVSDCAKLVE